MIVIFIANLTTSVPFLQCSFQLELGKDIFKGSCFLNYLIIQYEQRSLIARDG